MATLPVGSPVGVAVGAAVGIGASAGVGTSWSGTRVASDEQLASKAAAAAAIHNNIGRGCDRVSQDIGIAYCPSASEVDVDLGADRAD